MVGQLAGAGKFPTRMTTPRRVPDGITLIGRLFDEGRLGLAGIAFERHWRRPAKPDSNLPRIINEMHGIVAAPTLHEHRRADRHRVLLNGVDVSRWQ